MRKSIELVGRADILRSDFEECVFTMSLHTLFYVVYITVILVEIPKNSELLKSLPFKKNR